MAATKPAERRETKRDRRHAESQLRDLNTKIDRLLDKLDENEQDEARTPEEECVICVNSKATMRTWPCGHRVVCRKCLVRTIQMTVSRRSLPLRCVVCRARVLRLNGPSDDRETESSPPAAAAGVGSHSLPTTLRPTRVPTAAAVRSRSVAAGGSDGWTDAVDHHHHHRHHATSVRHSAPRQPADRGGHDGRRKNRLRGILGKFKFWRCLRSERGATP